MTVTRIAAALGLLGGVAWAARWLIEVSTQLSEALRVGGLVLLIIGFGVALLTGVGKSPVWLRALVAVGGAVAFWTILALALPADGSVAVDGILGGVIAGVCAAVVIWPRPSDARSGRQASRRAEATRGRRVVGTHSAR